MDFLQIIMTPFSWLLKTFAGDRANRGTNLFVDCNTWE